MTKPDPPEASIQHRWLCQVLRGHYRYYGVIFNSRALRAFQTCVVKLWRKTLGKRSQKGHVTWASYNRLLTVFPLPENQGTCNGCAFGVGLKRLLLDTRSDSIEGAPIFNVP